MIRIAATALLFCFLLVVPAAVAADMSTWESAVDHRCPAHHLGWICDGCWDDFLADFEQHLPKATQSKVLKLADYSHRCKAEVAGFSCEMSVHVDALSRLGLLNKFVDWGCENYRCEEAAICSRTPSHNPKR